MSQSSSHKLFVGTAPTDRLSLGSCSVDKTSDLGNKDWLWESEETAQSVKYMLHKQTDLSLISNAHVENKQKETHSQAWRPVL